MQIWIISRRSVIKTYDVLIIGGGPAGSSCAALLKKSGLSVLILDKAVFPRTKLCAGWVTPRVWERLGCSPGAYPRDLSRFDRFFCKFKGIPFSFKALAYAVKRDQFDAWLLERSGVETVCHKVKSVKEEEGGYVVDNKYRAAYLVGAGGTHCPVYKSLFKDQAPRDEKNLVVAVEQEFSYDIRDKELRLWFLCNGLPGYAWYVPKENGVVNVGLGAGCRKLARKKRNILGYWERFTGMLQKSGLIRGHNFSQTGYVYYLRDKQETVVRKKNAFLIGDAAGLATFDLAEGIGPAIESGQAAAQAIINSGEYSLDLIPGFSIRNSFFSFLLNRTMY